MDKTKVFFCLKNLKCLVVVKEKTVVVPDYFVHMCCNALQTRHVYASKMMGFFICIIKLGH